MGFENPNAWMLPAISAICARYEYGHCEPTG
jgi:hypothetical protein